MVYVPIFPPSYPTSITQDNVIFKGKWVLGNSSLESDNYPSAIYGSAALNVSQNLVDAFTDAEGYPVSESSVYDSAKPFANRDARLDMYVGITSIDNIKITVSRGEIKAWWYELKLSGQQTLLYGDGNVEFNNTSLRFESEALIPPVNLTLNKVNSLDLEGNELYNIPNIPFNIKFEQDGKEIYNKDVTTGKDGKIKIENVMPKNKNDITVTITEKKDIDGDGYKVLSEPLVITLQCSDDGTYWKEIWENRVVQLEKHKSELSLNKDIFYILNYYIGLIEICIYNYNLLIRKYGQKNGLSIQHNRIEFPMYSFSYYNPVNYLFDFEFRDFAEYLKMRFFYSDFSTDEAISVIDNYNFDNFSINMFFVRLIYPTYFLELYDMQNKNNVYSDLFYDLLKKSSQYENFILKLITAMSSKYEIIIKYPFIYQR